MIPRDRHAALLSALAERRLVARPVRDRDPPPAAHRGARGVRAVRRGPEGLVGDAAQAEPDRVRARSAGWPGCCAPTPLVGLENVALWHERDISHSSAERVVLPDSTIALDYMLDRVVWLAEGLAVDPAADAAQPGGVARAGVLGPGAAGAGRGGRLAARRAYEVVQRNALRAWDEETAVPRAAGGRPRRDRRCWTRPRSTGCSTSTSFLRHVDDDLRPHARHAGGGPVSDAAGAAFTRRPARCARCTASATRC